MPHPFMLSYARLDAKRIVKGKEQPDPTFEAFVEQLNQTVRQLTGEGPGFVDRNIELGEEWRDDIAEALATAKTMVCLYSPSYFKSENCGKEMQVFLERRQSYIRASVGKKPANIIPVVWHPIPRRIPKTLPDLQYKLDFDNEGIWKLGQTKKTLQSLLNVADQIAKRVRDADDLTPLPTLTERPRMIAVRNAFYPPPLPLPEFDLPGSRTGPDTVTFVYSSVTHWSAWPWAPPKEHAVLYLAAAVATGREMESTQLIFDLADEHLIDRLTKLRSQNNVVVHFVDVTSLSLEGLRARLSDCDRSDYASFSTIVLVNGNCTPETRAVIDQIFPYASRRAAPYFQIIETPENFNAETRERFSRIIVEVVEQLRLAVIKYPGATNSTPNSTQLPRINGPGRFQALQ